MALATCFAIAAERRRPLPADGMVPNPIFTSSRAITIDAPPEHVWPWIAQMGAGRAGWYSWDAIDNGGAPSGATDAFVVAAIDPLLLAFAGIGHRIMESRHLRGVQRRSAARPNDRARVERWREPLLTCGILAPVLYVAMTLFVGLLWEGYSVASRVPSELSAIGAPTRPLWISLGIVYAVLMIAFGWIVWTLAPPNRALRVVGALLMVYTVFGQFWPPMHQRAVLAAGGGTLTDTLHLVWAMITGFFFMLIVGFGAVALGKRFRIYSIATMVIGLACGAVTGTYASQVQADLPTPWVGVWERISIAAFMTWIAVLATALLWTGKEKDHVVPIQLQDSRR
ncbi:MAG TPA: DUF998 domain-containing protein [Vicinamibacterales bacterium]